MKRVDQIINLVRERTRNLNWGTDSAGVATEGLTDNLLTNYLNEAQDHLQAAILSVYPNEFVAQVVIPIVGGQEEYEITDRLFVNNKIISVQYRNGSQEADYRPLDQEIWRNRRTYLGYPDVYIRKGNIIMLNPIPQSTQGDVRITYYRELDDLDVRRGSISSHTASATALTALTLSTTDDDSSALEDADYLCINDRFGNVTMYNIPITGYDSTTGIVTIYNSSFTFATGETIANGDYVTVGKYTTTLSKLPDNCERYLQLYAQKRVLITDESNTSVEEDLEVKQVEQDILNSFADEDRDISPFPILDWDFML